MARRRERPDRRRPARAHGQSRGLLAGEPRGRRAIIVKGLITQRVLEGKVFSINVRHISGAETALQHGRITEVGVVREGSGVVSTGGTLVDPMPGAAPGEFSGRAIRGGVERVIKTGDLVFIPPGVPHGIKEATSITYLNIRFEARDAKE